MSRDKLPIHLKCVTTSLRLRPDRLEKYKALGGIKWLNDVIDRKKVSNEVVKKD